MFFGLKISCFGIEVFVYGDLIKRFSLFTQSLQRVRMAVQLEKVLKKVGKGLSPRVDIE